MITTGRDDIDSSSTHEGPSSRSSRRKALPSTRAIPLNALASMRVVLADPRPNRFDRHSNP
jgi:hypothetical protein